MANFVVRGGKKLSGSIAANSAKNSAVAILCACLMIKGKVTLRDVPEIEEVKRLLEVLSSIGVVCRWKSNHILEIDASGPVRLSRINKAACSKIRSSLLLFGALASRVKSFRMFEPGGCTLGVRSVTPHVLSLKKLGVDIIAAGSSYRVTNKKLKGAEVVMYESGDTPTENVIMAAALASGETVIKFASANYMVQDLCYFLNTAGAKISGIGTRTLVIRGVKRLRPIAYPIMPDPPEAMAFIALAIVTHSGLVIKNCPLDFLELELEILSVMGQKFALSKKRKSKNGKFAVVDIQIFPSKLTALPDKIHGMPFPGVNIDHVPFFVPIATQAKGRTLIHDWVFENRTKQYALFQRIGAKVKLLDPHRVFVDGLTVLKGNSLTAPAGIRPAMALLVGMIAAKGTSVLRDIYVIERGYENLAERLRRVGADIQRVE